MKSKFISLIIILSYPFFVIAQVKEDLMKVDAGLLQNSMRYQIKSKGMSNLIPKIYFKDYKLEFAKAGWEKGFTRERAKLFYPEGAFDSNSKSNQKYSYVFIGPENNSLIANVSAFRSQDIFQLEGERYTTSKIREIKIEFYTVLSLKLDSSEWQLLIKYAIGSKVPDQFQFSGTLTDGVRTIEIRPVVEHMSGMQNPRFYGTLGVHYGYEFVLGDEAIAALQARFINKDYIWFKKDMGSDLEFAIAGSIPSILFMMNWIDDSWEQN